MNVYRLQESYSVLVTACNYNNGKVVSTFPLPKIQELLSRLNNCKYSSSLDLHLGYYHISLTEEAKKKTAFVIADGKYQWNIATGLNDFVFMHLDDVLIFSKSCK